MADRTVEIPSLESMTIESFIDCFHDILEWKRSRGWSGYHDNPTLDRLKEQAEFYGERYANGSYGWGCNIWSRSKDNTDVVEDSSELKPEHKLLMRSALEYVLAPNTLIRTDGVYGQHDSVKFHCRIWTDAHYPDVALRWRELTFPPPEGSKPNAEALMLPGLWTPATMPGSDGKRPIFMIRFPEHWFTLGSVSSYQGEWKKMALTHWIYHAYLQGGTGVHAGSRQFTVKDRNGSWKDIGMVVWGLTGSGKSTHGMYVFDEGNARYYKERGLDVLGIVKDQYVKNDDVVGLFVDSVRGSENGAWTKTEDVDESQTVIYKAGMSPRAFHENTTIGDDGNPDFLDESLQYRGRPNKNARTVMYLSDMKPNFDGSIDIDFPPNMAVFISPGYLTDYAWVKLADPEFASAVYAAGRTVGHPAQSAEGIGEEKYSPLYNPFIIGKKARNADHVHRFNDILHKRIELAESGEADSMDCYLINTTGRVGTEYKMDGGDPKPIFEDVKGKRKPVGGTGPKIEETELFLIQAARDLVEYGPHPIWGDKVLVPLKVPCLDESTLSKFDPFAYRDMDEMLMMLTGQVNKIRKVFDTQVQGLRKEIYTAMDF